MKSVILTTRFVRLSATSATTPECPIPTCRGHSVHLRHTSMQQRLTLDSAGEAQNKTTCSEFKPRGMQHGGPALLARLEPSGRCQTQKAGSSGSCEARIASRPVQLAWPKPNATLAPQISSAATHSVMPCTAAFTSVTNPKSLQGLQDLRNCRSPT